MTETLATRLRAGGPVSGLVVPLPGLFAIEVAAAAGLDYVVLDAEHGPRDELSVHHHVAVARSRGLDAVVRISAVDLDTAPRLLDLGAAGIMLPDVRSGAEARRFVDRCSYPPRGSRGFATLSPAAGFGARSVQEQLDAGSEVALIAMIESPEGVAAAADILATDGICATLVGAADLRVNLGIDDPSTPERVAAALSSVREAARAAGVGCIALSPGADAPPGPTLVNAARLLADALRDRAPRASRSISTERPS